jgi:hypothetical protein
LDKPLLALKIKEPGGLLQALPAPRPGLVRPYEADQVGEAAQTVELEQTGLPAEPEVPEASLGDAREESGAGGDAPDREEQPLLPDQGNNQEDKPGWRRWAWDWAWDCAPGCRAMAERIVGKLVPGKAGEEDEMATWRREEMIRKRIWELLGKHDRSQADPASDPECEPWDEMVSKLYELLRLRCLQAGAGKNGCGNETEAAEISGNEPEWVQEITQMLGDGIAVSEIEAERLKKRLGGQGSVRSRRGVGEKTTREER